MLNITITEQTPHNMLRAIRAACNELLGETRQAGEQEWPHAVSADEKAAQHVTEANRLNAAANSELDQAAASLSSHNAEQTILANAFDKAVEAVGAPAVAQALQNEQTPADEILTGFDVDRTGAEWNAELHASTKTKNADGTWKKRRGSGKAEDPVAEAERIHESFANAVDVQTVEVQTPAMPPAPAPTFPPLPPAAPLVTMNDIYALIQTGKCVLNDVIAGAHAKGFADVGAFSRDATPEQRAELLQELTA